MLLWLLQMMLLIDGYGDGDGNGDGIDAVVCATFAFQTVDAEECDFVFFSSKH